MSKPKRDLEARDMGIIFLCLCLAAGNGGATIKAGFFLLLCVVGGAMAGARDLKQQRKGQQ